MDRINEVKLSYNGSGEGRSATISLPASKSISNRLLVIKKLTDRSLHIENLSKAHDTVVFKRALTGPGELKDLGAAGTAMRFGIAWAAVTPGMRLLTGDGRLRQRPVQPLVEVLVSLGANIDYLESPGFPPLRISGGTLKGGVAAISGEMSSQFVSALMLIGPVMENGVEINISGSLVSRPYVNMTANLMRRFGAEVNFADENCIRVSPGSYDGGTITVEGDWSAASYFYSWVALNPGVEIALSGLEQNSIQGDSILVDLYRQFGVATSFSENKVILKNTGQSNPKEEIDCSDFPDLAQTIACTAAGLQKPIKLVGLQTLQIKESERISALAAELQKLGVSCNHSNSHLKLRDFSEDRNPDFSINTYNDHRMAMSFAPLVSKFSKMRIENPEVVAKSFPDFWKEFAKLGVSVQTTD